MHIYAILIITALLTVIIATGTTAYKLGRMSGYEKGLDDALKIVEESHSRVMENYKERSNA